MTDTRKTQRGPTDAAEQWNVAQEALRACLAACREREGAPLAVANAAPLTPKHMERPINLFLGLLLRAMQAKFLFDKNYRENIANFTAQYVFTDKTEKIHQVVHFAEGKMRVDQKEPKDPTFVLTFRDGASLMKLLFSPAPDVLNALLNQEVDFVGNLNYLNKFAYMALLAKPGV